MNNELICEHCNSNNVRMINVDKVMTVLAECYCEDCGEYFKQPITYGEDFALFHKASQKKYKEGEYFTQTVYKTWIEIYNERLKESLDYLYNTYVCSEQINEVNSLHYKQKLDRAWKIYFRDSMNMYTKIYEHVE